MTTEQSKVLGTTMSKEGIGGDDNELSAAYVLHTRKYRDTSLIAELYTKDHGRVAVVAKGVRSRRAVRQASWQPFTPLLVSFMGRGDLKTVTVAEFSNTGFRLEGDNLIMGLYVNELMVRLLAKNDPLENLFGFYQEVLKNLMAGDQSLISLRKFEIFLLQALGYGVDFEKTAMGEPIKPETHYEYQVGNGFSAISERSHEDMGDDKATSDDVRVARFKGKTLLAIADQDFSGSEVSNSAKVILRTTFHHLLGGKPLMSRKLFVR
jgi:DNA repair protein RecO (recombination protein O)